MKISKFLAVAMLAFSALAAAANPEVELKTNMGTITLELYPDKAPKTVENFLQYVKDGHFKGTIFHRVINGFMVQGGGFTPEYAQKKTRAPVQNEANKHHGREEWLMANKPEIYWNMLQTAEYVSKKYGISREAQDRYGVESQNRAAKSRAA